MKIALFSRFFVNPMNLVDLFAILPYFVSLIIDHLSEFHIIGKTGKVLRLIRVTRWVGNWKSHVKSNYSGCTFSDNHFWSESCASSNWSVTLLASNPSSAPWSKPTKSWGCWSCWSPWPCWPSPLWYTLLRKRSRTGPTWILSGGGFLPSQLSDTVSPFQSFALLLAAKATY